MRLTNKQKRFVEEYLIDLNASQAAIRAGYSPKTAQEQSYQLIRKTSVAAAIKEAMQKRSRRTGLTQDMVLEELSSIAFARLSDVMDWGETTMKQVNMDGEIVDIVHYGLKLKGSKDIPQHILPALAKIKEDKHGLTVEMHNKIQALTLLGKHLGMFIDRTEITGKDGGAIELTDTERAAKLSALVSVAQKRKAESDACTDN